LPELEQANIDTEKLMAKIEIDTKDANETRVTVSAEEAIAKKQADEAQAIADQANLAVQDANEKLDLTLEEVKKLKKDHIVEVKSLSNPPIAVHIILGGTCILLLDEIKKKGGDIEMRKVEGSLTK
jgi:dynein heavy chain, axonemal